MSALLASTCVTALLVMSLVSMVFTLLKNRKSRSGEPARHFVLHRGESSASSHLLHAVLRLPTVVVVVDGHRVRGGLVRVPDHVLHTPVVRVVVKINSGTFCNYLPECGAPVWLVLHSQLLVII